MSSQAERWQRLDALFAAALALPPDARERFFASACGDDVELRAELEALVAAHGKSGILDHPALPLPAPGSEGSRDTALQPGSRLGPYEIVAALGAGGMGEVWRARDTRLGREVAIKVLPARLAADADALARLEREARAVAALSHPGIVALYDVGREDGTAYLVMELLPGESLAARLDRGPLPLSEALAAATQVAEALAAAHRLGIVHRDLKPGNVMLTRGGVKLLDFGLAKRRATLSPGAAAEWTQQATTPGLQAAVTTEGTLLGTLHYMAPEQIEGREADARSDLFAFGAVVYEMVTGQRAFAGATPASIVAAILKDQPRPLAELVPIAPPALDRLVRRCLEKDPDERWQSAADLAEALRWLERDAATAPGTAAGGAKQDGRATSRPRVRRWVASAALTLLGLVCLAWGLDLVRERAARPPTVHQLSFRRGKLHSARFTPDGSTVVYATAAESTAPSIFTARLEAPESQALSLAGAELLAVSSQAELAVSLDHRFLMGFEARGTLARVPLGGGEPRPLAESVYGADWSPDGQALAVAREVGEQRRLEYPLGTVLFATDGWISNPRVSPNGRTVAFVAHPLRSEGTGYLTVASSGEEPRRLSAGPCRGLAWAPSGDEIWCSRDGEIVGVSLRSGRERQVFTGMGFLRLEDVSRDGRMLVAQGSLRRELVVRPPGAPADERSLSWLDWSFPKAYSRDGRAVLFEEQGPAQGGADSRGFPIYYRNVDGSPPMKLGEGSALAITPDGGHALLDLGARDDDPHLTLVPLGAGEPRAVAAHGLVAPSSAVWVGDRDQVLVRARDASGPGVFLLTLDGSPMRRLMRGAGSTGTYPVSPDERAFAVAQGGRLELVPLDGEPARPVAGAGAADRPVGWSRDGRWLYVIGRATVPQLVERLEIATGRREPWRAIGPADPVGVAGVLPLVVLPDGDGYYYSYRRELTDLYLLEGVR